MSDLQAMIAEYKKLDARASHRPWKLWDSWRGDEYHVERIGPVPIGGLASHNGMYDISGEEADIQIAAISRNFCPDLIAALEAAWVALRMVEWVDGKCPWCGGWNPDIYPGNGHLQNCDRQAALGEAGL